MHRLSDEYAVTTNSARVRAYNQRHAAAVSIRSRRAASRCDRRCAAAGQRVAGDGVAGIADDRAARNTAIAAESRTCAVRVGPFPFCVYLGNTCVNGGRWWSK